MDGDSQTILQRKDLAALVDANTIFARALKLKDQGYFPITVDLAVSTAAKLPPLVNGETLYTRFCEATQDLENTRGLQNLQKYCIPVTQLIAPELHEEVQHYLS